MRANLICNTDSNLYCRAIHVTNNGASMSTGPNLDLSANAGLGQQYTRAMPLGDMETHSISDMSAFDFEHTLVCGSQGDASPSGHLNVNMIATVAYAMVYPTVLEYSNDPQSRMKFSHTEQTDLLCYDVLQVRQEN